MSKEEKKAIREKNNKMFSEHLDTLIDKNVRKSLKAPSKDNQEKTIFLYKALNTIREDMIANGKDTRAISQAMVDLIHTSGFGNTFYTSLLRSKNPKEQLEGVNKILDERNSIALALGFEDHFPELMRSLNMDHPTGSTKRANLAKVLRNIEKDIENMPYTSTQTSVLRVRALSLQESPFRSCLGGSDCSSNSYFEKALDPNFLYFTITDANHNSSGHITVVLGTAENVKIAFVDKIQNVPNERILPMLQSIRLSLMEQGYRLGLPKDIGNVHTGLSNMGITMNYIQSEINPKLKTVFTGFKPHENKYSFDSGYSKAYSEPELLEFELVEDIGVKIEPGEIKQPQNAPEDLNVESLYEEVLSLQHSEDEEDQIKFINSLIGLNEVEGLDLSYPSDNFLSRYFRRFRKKASNDNFVDDYLTQKIDDPKNSFKLRKLVLWTLMEFLHEKYDIFIHGEIYKKLEVPVAVFLKSWDKFSTKEQDILFGEVSNWRHSKNPWKSSLFKKLSKKFTGNIDYLHNIQYILEHRLASLFINMTREYVTNGLLIAAGRGKIESLHLLIKKGADINSRGLNNKTALILAAANGQTEAVDFLLKRGANIHDYDINNQTALTIAAENGHKDVVALLEKAFNTNE